MRNFIDTEFIEDGKTIDLISIGIVAEDGRELYAQSVEFDFYKASDWVKENVLTHLGTCPHEFKPKQLEGYTLVERDFLDHPFGRSGTILRKHHVPGADYSQCPWRTRRAICAEILAFMDPLLYGKPELWGYYSAYDHVAFCQLFGTMMDLPKVYPMYTRDIKQWCDALGNPPLPRQGKDEHNALADAKHNYVMWKFLDAWAKTKLIGQ